MGQQVLAAFSITDLGMQNGRADNTMLFFGVPPWAQACHPAAKRLGPARQVWLLLVCAGVGGNLSAPQSRDKVGKGWTVTVPKQPLHVAVHISPPV